MQGTMVYYIINTPGRNAYSMVVIAQERLVFHESIMPSLAVASVYHESGLRLCVK